MLLFWLYHNNPWWKKGSKQTKYLLLLCPKTFLTKGCFQSYKRGHPHGGTFVLKSDFGVLKNVYSGLISAETHFSHRETLWSEAQRRAAIASPVPTTLPQPQLPWGGEREVRKEEVGEKRCQVLTCMDFSLCWQPTCMLSSIQPHFSVPLRNNPFSLPKEF